MRNLFFCSTLLFFQLISAQVSEYSSLSIPENLRENANSVIRNQTNEIHILSQKAMTVKLYRVITILNKFGLSDINAMEYYSDSEKIQSIQATIYDAYGKEIKKIRRGDFKDQSLVDGFSILSDQRILFLDYTPIDYPFTVVFESETKTSNTAFIPTWNPIEGFYESVQKSTISVEFPSELGFKYKEVNFGTSIVKKEITANKITYAIENVLAEKPEELAPSFDKIVPSVKFALEKFNLEGVEVNAKSWEEFGSSWYKNLISDTEELSPETQKKIQDLIGNETNPIKKAKIIYKYVQDKTRYVSIQLGIGGWKPMLAKDVDRLGYGDCKALSNYTRVLLKSIGVEAYYTVIFGSSQKKDFDKDFVSKQGNHIILALPIKGEYTFLECTSQTLPFGFQGDFTDDRYALVIKPERGEIIRTKAFIEKSNSKYSKGTYAIDSEGSIAGSVLMKSKGIQYDNNYMLERSAKDNVEQHYKDYFYWINNLKLGKIKFNNNVEDVEFTEDLQLSATNYGKITGNMMMIPINLYNQNTNIPQRYRTRKNSFEISRGFYDEDEIEIMLPQGYKLDSKPDDFQWEDKFGSYKMELKISSSNTLIYKRIFFLKKGYYEKDEYENYRKFREQVAKYDNSKIVLTKI